MGHQLVVAGFMTNNLLLKMVIEILDFPSRYGDFPDRYVTHSLPEGTLCFDARFFVWRRILNPPHHLNSSPPKHLFLSHKEPSYDNMLTVSTTHKQYDYMLTNKNNT